MNVSLEQQQQLQHDLQRLTDIVNSLERRMAVAESLDERHAALCPYKTDINRASNNITRLSGLEDKVTDLRLNMARIAGIIGLAGTVTGGLIVPLIQKALGL